MGHDAAEERVRRRGHLVGVGVERVAGERGEVLDVLAGDGAAGRGHGVADLQLGHRLAERVGAVLDRGGAGGVHPCEGPQDRRGALDRGALQVVVDRPHAPELLPATGPAGTAVHQVRQWRAVPRRLGRAVAVQDQQPAVVGGGAEHHLPHEVRVVADHRGDQAPAAERQQLDDVRGAVVGQQRRDRSEGLDLVHRRRGRVVVPDEHGPQEGAALQPGQLRVRVADDELPALAEPADRRTHVLALPPAHQRPHRRRAVAGVADDHLVQGLAQRSGHRLQVLPGHERPPDRGALLTCLGGHLAHDLAHEQLELRAAGAGVGAEHAAVERVGLGREAHPARHHRLVTAQHGGRRRRAGEGQRVLPVQAVEQALRPADEQLQGALRQQPRLGHDAHDVGRDVGGLAGRLDDARHPGQEGRRQLLQHPPDREVVGVDLHRRTPPRRHDVAPDETACPTEHLDRSVDEQGAGGQLATPAAGVGEQGPEPAVDVDQAVLVGRPGGVGQLVAGVALTHQQRPELLEDGSPVVEGHRPQCGSPDGPGVLQGLGGGDRRGRHAGHLDARGRVQQRSALVLGRAPAPGHPALDQHRPVPSS